MPAMSIRDRCPGASRLGKIRELPRPGEYHGLRARCAPNSRTTRRVEITISGPAKTRKEHLARCHWMTRLVFRQQRAAGKPHGQRREAFMIEVIDRVGRGAGIARLGRRNRPPMSPGGRSCRAGASRAEPLHQPAWQGGRSADRRRQRRGWASGATTAPGSTGNR